MARNVQSSPFSSLEIEETHQQSNDASTQSCCMRVVGTINDKSIRDEFLSKMKTEINTDEYEAPTSISGMEDENIEKILENITLTTSFEENSSRYNNSSRYESYFSQNFNDSMKKKTTYQELQDICRRYERQKGGDFSQAMTEHNKRVAQTWSYFQNHGLPENEAQAAALAVSFYTGTKGGMPSSNTNKQEAIKYRSGRVFIDQKEPETEKIVVCNYLQQALLKIPFYHGYVSRSCRVEDKELKFYTPGSIVLWSQFNGSFKGKDVISDFDFSTRNTFFKIYSLSGRPIKMFSNFEEEDEILFLPDSTFLVLNHTISHHGTQHTIYMRQVELGLSTSAVLWVDDHIFTRGWNNQQHMIYAESKDPKKNIRFIQKSSTDSALSFLKSPFGQLLKNKETFRIVTDMRRDNENPSHNAGARFIKGLRSLGFNNRCCLFVGNQKGAEEVLKQEFGREDSGAVKITTANLDIKKFISFDSE